MKLASKYKVIWGVWVFLITFTASYTVNAKPANSYTLTSDTVAEEIRHKINAIDPNLAIGVHIKSMKYGDTLYARNDKHLFIPASILKVFTAESALLFLGPDYRFTTKFVTNAASIKNGTLQGNIYLVLSGDPSLIFSDIVELMQALKAHHIQRIQGNVYIDDTAYDQQSYGPGWLWNDKRFCYSAPISASIINHNCLIVRLTPNSSTGRLANIVPDQHYFYSAIHNNVVTKPSSARTCYIHLGADANNNNALALSGCIPKGKYTQSVSSVIYNLMHYHQSMLTNLFKQYQIAVGGSVTPGAAPKGLAVLATHESKPLRELITEMLKKSDNIIAGSLFKKLGEIHSRQPGSWDNGSTAVTNILSSRMGVDVDGISIKDGSGLSRYNLVTPAQMIRVLDFAYHHDASNYDFISALPVAGVDGTLKYRLHNVAWKVRAKTGTLSGTGVAALAGYAVNRDNELLAFVIMINGHVGMGWKYRGLEDDIVTILTRHSRL